MTKNILYKKFTRRSLILSIGQYSLFAVLVLKLFDLQILNKKKYQVMADKNRLRLIFIPVARGKIYDINDIVIANNKTIYSLSYQGKINYNIVQNLMDILNWDKKRQQDFITNLSKKNGYNHVIIKSLTWDELLKIEANIDKLPNFIINKDFQRYYPNNNNFAHVLGYTSIINNTECVGKSGLEKYLNNSISGKQGIKKVEINSKGKVVNELATDPPISAQDVHTTLDSRIQNICVTNLEKEQGAVVVMDVRTGAILAMVSKPDFDPNILTSNLTHQEWNKIINNSNKTLVNRCISEIYPPGSTLKIASTLAALRHGISSDLVVNCTGSIQVGKRIFHCHKHTGHGPIKLEDALARSCNVYLWHLARIVGINELSKAMWELGLGNLTNIELEGEKPGLVPTKTWKLFNKGNLWTAGDSMNAFIGQGYALTTPIQLAVMTSRVASGKMIYPTLLKDKTNNENLANLPFDEEYLEIVRRSMFKVMNDPLGTSFQHRITNKNFLLAGKTGTSQVVARNVYQQSQLSKFRNHGLFIGYAPFDNPTYAISVVVEHGGSGSGSAAPIAKNILEKIYKECI